MKRIYALMFFVAWGPLLLADDRPNILFIFSDDHSCQSIGAYDMWLSNFARQHEITPNIDNLAEQGAIFTQSFCGNSICSPSRATVLSGMHTHVNGVTHLNGRIRDGVWTFPPALQAAGYQTALVGKWHLQNEPMGFDFYRVLPGQGSYWQPTFLGPDGFTEKKQGYATDIITDKALDWLKSRDKTKPFVLLCHHKAPHGPWEPPTRYYQLLAHDEVPEPPTLFDDYSGRSSAASQQLMEIGRDMTLDRLLKVLPPGEHPAGLNAEQVVAWEQAYGPRNEAFRQAKLEGKKLTRWKFQAYMKDYLRCVKAVDDSVGTLRSYLEEEGIDKNTIVVYAADQSFFNGEHGWYDKRWIYEESIRMPLIIYWPTVTQANMRIQKLVQNIDYAPTLMEMAGVDAPRNLHGRSLVPLLRGEPPIDWRKSIYYRYYDPGHNVSKHYGVRTDRYTLAHFYPTDEWELFDLQNDPQQMQSVYRDPDYAQAVSDLKAELLRLRKFYDDMTVEEPTASKGKKR